MSRFHLRTFSKPEDFVDACVAFDDSFMNYPLGALLDSIQPSFANTLSQGDQPPHISLAVYDGNDVMWVVMHITFSKTGV